MNKQREITLTNTNQPTTITDNIGFKSLVDAWKYADVWDKFDLIYDTQHDVPQRLCDYTIIRCDDPNEQFGILLKMTPCIARNGGSNAYFGKKLLAKVRLN